jgi:spoIIIJ-associated protein
MRSLEKRGKTVEEAVAAALEELGANEDEAQIEVLEEPAKGLFGILGSKDARVRVSLKESREDAAKRFLSQVLETMGYAPAMETAVEDGYVFINVLGDDLGALIGHRGQTLSALQYLVNLAVSRSTAGDERIVLDIEGYRKRRERTLQTLAQRLAERVRRTGHSVALEPMTAQERRVVHTTLQDDPQVVTKSEGEDPFRKVIIYPKK